MPIFRINTELHYFAHVPKCGGTAVEDYLIRRFGPMALLTPVLPHIALGSRWTRTNAQHITAADLSRVIPDGWITSSFAVVRHPLRRMISIFNYGRDLTRPRIALSTDFNAWCAEAIPRMAHEPFRLDGHLQPQVAFLPKGTRVFRFEDGLDRIPAYIDNLTGTTSGAGEILAKNVGKWRAEEAPPVPDQKTLDLITTTYAEDFARLGYDMPESVEAALALPDLPILTATGKPPEPNRRSFSSRLYRSLLKRAGG